MALTNMQYDEIIRSYNRIQLENKRKQNERIQTVISKIPRIEEINSEISSLSLQTTKLMLLQGQDSNTAISEFKSKKNNLIAEKYKLLSEHGFSKDYMDLRYNCPTCKDTGYITAPDNDAPNIKCQCFKKAEIDILYSDSNIKDIIKIENFGTFKYEAFDNKTINNVNGKTPLDNIREIRKICENYIENFDSKERKYKNLMFLGETGVGKTFLTHCIAKELIEKTFSVIYLSAIELFNILADAQFSRENIDAKHKSSKIYDCDLLIIDDLGTELLNSYTASAFFNIVNERSISNKSCIISTNLDLQDLTERYSERLTSRLTKDYKFMKVFGDDLRRKKF